MQSKKLSIAMFHLAFVYSGGGERLVLEEAIGLQKLGHRVTIFTPILTKKNCFPELLEQVSVKTIVPKLPQWLPDVELLSIILSCLLVPFRWKEFAHFDVYFGANQPGPWLAYILSKLNKKPYAIYLAQPTRLIHPRLIDQTTGLKLVDGITMLPLLSWLFRPIIHYMDRKSITGAPLVFANGSYMKGVLDEVYGITSINCPAGSKTHARVSVSHIQKRLKGFVTFGKKRIKKPYILLTNRHFPQKRFEYAIEALTMLPQAVSLVITGKDTNYTKYLKKLTTMRHNVHFVGLLPEKSLEKAYKNAAAYVYPSPQEDFGMGIIEAMSHGVPVVAWNNAGPTGIITTGFDGFLATPFVIREFAQFLQDLLHNNRLYKEMARHAQQSVAEKFSFDRHNAMISRYVQRLVGYTGR